MRIIAIHFAASSVLSCFALAAVVAGAPPIPPVKSGLWETKMTALDANGQEITPPEQAGLSRLPPEARARMAETMKSRGVSMPDANGVTKVCLTKDVFESGAWQQLAADAGCTTNYSTQTNSSWKWHTSCPARKSESDGEAVFSSPERYRVTLTMTATMNGKTNTSTRVVQSKWLGADCGDIKPLTPPKPATPPRPGRG
jgi:hypothetical protein